MINLPFHWCHCKWIDRSLDGDWSGQRQLGKWEGCHPSWNGRSVAVVLGASSAGKIECTMSSLSSHYQGPTLKQSRRHTIISESDDLSIRNPHCGNHWVTAIQRFTKIFVSSGNAQPGTNGREIRKRCEREIFTRSHGPSEVCIVVVLVICLSSYEGKSSLITFGMTAIFAWSIIYGKWEGTDFPNCGVDCFNTEPLFQWLFTEI
jgi:hypothetical protein